MFGRTWTDCVAGELMEDSGGAVNRDTVAGWSSGMAVDVAVETPSASFCETFPTAAFREGQRSGKRGGAEEVKNRRCTVKDMLIGPKGSPGVVHWQ